MPAFPTRTARIPVAALALVGASLFMPAGAQQAGIQFLPIPNEPPAYLFAPGPLSGSMLRPLSVPTPGAGTEVQPEPGPAPSVVARTESEVAPEAAPAPSPPPAVVPEAPPAAAPEPPPPAAVTPPPAPATGTVTVIVENVETSTGTVNVAVCDKGLSREGCPYSHEIQASQGFVQVEFDNIPPGNYAVVGYHDVNGNNEFDKLFGMPREPYALSSRAADKLVPTFADAALPIAAGPNSVIIRLKRLGG